MIINYSKNPLILNKFLKYLLGVRGFSAYTVRDYNYDLLLFFNFINKYKDFNIDIKQFNAFILLSVTKADIIAFLVYCNISLNNAPATRSHKVASIKSFYNWLLSTIPGGDERINPSINIPKAGKVSRLPKYLTLSQTKLIQNVFTKENSRFPIRNNMIITLFLTTGARLSELVNINLKDIDFNTNSIKIIGKGNKERLLYFNTSCKKKLLEYIKYRNADKEIINLDEALFLSNNGKRLGNRSVMEICKKAYSILGINEPGYTTHTLRHTAATLLYKNSNQDILLVKAFLGHESISSTEIYTHVYNEQAREAVEKNPLNNFIPDKKKVA